MRVPKFQRYYPSTQGMSSEQRLFYRHLVQKIQHQKYPSVEGNISYLFIYAYDLLSQWDQTGFDSVCNQLLDIAEAYHHEKKFAHYCRRWSYDCLLGLEKYREYLLLTEPEDIFSSNTHFSNERCNIYYLLKKPVPAVDLLKMAGVKVTIYTKKHPAAFRDLLETTFVQDAKKNGPWLNRLLSAQGRRQKYGHTLFGGAPISHPEPNFPYYCFYGAYDFLDGIGDLVRVAENQLREINNIPKIGEGWISETDLFYAVKGAFPQTQVLQHGRPEWLGRQHLDIWMPRWKIAVEYQGTQHFEPVEFFGGEQGLTRTRERDVRKEKLCKTNNVDLITVVENAPHEQVIENIKRSRAISMKTKRA